jgi:hypothetical protein
MRATPGKLVEMILDGRMGARDTGPGVSVESWPFE